MSAQRTILITSFFGLIARDILGTKILNILKLYPDVRIVILVPIDKISFFEKQFGATNVLVEGVLDVPLSFKESLVGAFFLNLLNTDTRKIQRLVKFKQSKERFNYWLTNFIAFWGGFKFIVQSARFLFGSIEYSKSFDSYFKKYQPDILFSTDIMTPNDIRFMRLARSNNVPIVGMVRSWDNLTLYGILPVIPNQIIVQNESIKEELMKYQFVSNKAVSIVGIPHYDECVLEARTPREAFFKKLGLSSNKKTVLFTPTAIKHWGDPNTNIKILEALSMFDVNVLARLPIMGEINLEGFVGPPNVVLDKPPRTKESVDAVLNREANNHLLDTIFHSDVVITGPSTIMIDAIIFNKPVVYVNFDSDSKTPYWKSATRFMSYNHIKTIFDSGGIKVADSLKDLEYYVKQYLNDPNLDKEKRQELVLQKCYKLDGQSAERLTKIILNQL